MEAHNIATSLFRAIYRRKAAKKPGPKKPWLAWFPKYRFTVRPAAEIVDSEAPEQVLEARLAPLGFALDYWTREGIHFARGKTWGDFSIRLVRLHLCVALPLKYETEVTLQVADVCLFDTGDLWTLTRELREILSDDGDNIGRVGE